MKTSACKDGETKQKQVTKQDTKENNTDDISIDENEYKILKQKAELYDEISLKCKELEKEIADLQIKYSLSEEEMKKIDDEVRSEIEGKITNKEEVKRSQETGPRDPIQSQEKVKEARVKTSSSSSSKNVSKDDEFVLDKENKAIPSDWKILKRKSDKKRKFESPEGFSFTSRSEALQFMIKNNYPEHLLNLMRNHLTDEGWYFDKSCPNKWKLRKISGIKDYEYLSPSMNIIPSMKEMMIHLKSQVPTNSKEIRNLETKMNSLQARSDVRDVRETEKQTEILPSGSGKKMTGEGQEGISSKRKIEQVGNVQKKCKEERNEKKAQKEENIKKLEEHFQVSMIPGLDKIGEIRENVGMSESEVKNWFLSRVSEEGKKRLKTSDDKTSRENSKGTQKRNVKSFNELTELQKNALQNVFKTSQTPSDDQVSQLSTKHLIDKQLILKWFQLKRQQKAPSQ